MHVQWKSMGQDIQVFFKALILILLYKKCIIWVVQLSKTPFNGETTALGGWPSTLHVKSLSGILIFIMCKSLSTEYLCSTDLNCKGLTVDWQIHFADANN